MGILAHFRPLLLSIYKMCSYIWCRGERVLQLSCTPSVRKKKPYYRSDIYCPLVTAGYFGIDSDRVSLLVKDGNGSGSDRVESPCTQNRNPKSKPESAPKTDSGGNPSPKPNPRIPETRTDTRNPNGYPKPADIYTHIHMYKQEATNNKYFHEST